MKIKKEYLKLLLIFLNILHTSFGIFWIIPIFSNNKKYLTICYYFSLITIINWFIFNGNCFLSLIENYIYKIINNKRDKNSESRVSAYLKKYFGIKVGPNFGTNLLYTIIYTSMIILYFKLDRLKECLILLFGWILYEKNITSNIFKNYS